MDLNFDETYTEWADRVGIIRDEESYEAWEHQQLKIDALRGVIRELSSTISR